MHIVGIKQECYYTLELNTKSYARKLKTRHKTIHFNCIIILKVLNDIIISVSSAHRAANACANRDKNNKQTELTDKQHMLKYTCSQPACCECTDVIQDHHHRRPSRQSLHGDDSVN